MANREPAIESHASSIHRAWPVKRASAAPIVAIKSANMRLAKAEDSREEARRSERPSSHLFVKFNHRLLARGRLCFLARSQVTATNADSVILFSVSLAHLNPWV